MIVTGNIMGFIQSERNDWVNFWDYDFTGFVTEVELGKMAIYVEGFT